MRLFLEMLCFQVGRQNTEGNQRLREGVGHAMLSKVPGETELRKTGGGLRKWQELDLASNVWNLYLEAPRTPENELSSLRPE